jgi:hypothetical protein
MESWQSGHGTEKNVDTIWPGLFGLLFFGIIVVLLFIVIPVCLATSRSDEDDEPVEDFF